jgi:hypothetical protein
VKVPDAEGVVEQLTRSTPWKPAPPTIRPSSTIAPLEPVVRLDLCALPRDHRGQLGAVGLLEGAQDGAGGDRQGYRFHVEIMPSVA